MQLAPRDPSLPFVAVTALPKADGPAPKAERLWTDRPKDATGLVSIRYRGTDRDGSVQQRTVRNNPMFTGQDWHRVTGSFDDAVRAARELAVVDGYHDDPATGNFARTSVAVLDAGQGVYDLLPLAYPDGLGDGMDAIISMPIDAVVAESTSQVSIAYGAMSGTRFDRPDKGVSVRFDDPRVAAVVGVDSIAIAPTR